jgi:hypothetical protein
LGGLSPTLVSCEMLIVACCFAHEYQTLHDRWTKRDNPFSPDYLESSRCRPSIWFNSEWVESNFFQLKLKKRKTNVSQSVFKKQHDHTVTSLVHSEDGQRYSSQQAWKK